MQQSKSKLFLIELIIIILFFAITSAVCMNILRRGSSIAKKVAELRRVAALCQQAAEIFKGTARDEDVMADMLGASRSKDELYIDYGNGFKKPEKDAAAVYRMEISFEEQGDVKSAVITMSKSQNQIYSLEAARYMGV